MDEIEMPLKQNKAKINATVSVWVDRKIKEYSRTDEYSSISNFIESAIVYYIGSLERENELKKQAVEENATKERQEYEKQAKQKEANNQEATAILLKIITKHPEIANELNDNSKTDSLNPDKRVYFK